MAVPFRREGWGKGRAVKGKKLIFTFFFDGEVPTAIRLEGGGGEGLNDTAIDFCDCNFKRISIIELNKTRISVMN